MLTRITTARLDVGTIMPGISNNAMEGEYSI
jgi:hypothetical protein